MRSKILLIAGGLMIFGFLGFGWLTSAQSDGFKYPDISKGRGLGAKGAEEFGKLSSELRILLAQYRDATDGETGRLSFSSVQLEEIFGIDAAEDQPSVSLAVTIDPKADPDRVGKAGMKIYLREENVLYGKARVIDLGQIEKVAGVVKVTAVKAARTPRLPRKKRSPLLMKDFTVEDSRGGSAEKLPANQFDKGNLSGKNVIIGIIDTGIDWRHPDFIKSDGTSRILAIWDFFDDSYRTSGGRIGSKPPTLGPGGEQLDGTVYTNAQINAALRGAGEVNSSDNSGHGTSVAGTAAGNGRASDGKYAGVAPEADLLIFKTSDCDRSSSAYIYGAYWMISTARSRKKPIAINISFGAQLSAHDGNEVEEEYLNNNSGKGFPGIVYTVSAGNEGRYNLHSAGRFGPKKAGQLDQISRPLSVTISSEKTEGKGSLLLGLFDTRDDWGVLIESKIANGWTDGGGRPISFYIYKHRGEIKYLLSDGLVKPDWFDAFARDIISGSETIKTKDLLHLKLPPGSYQLTGFGATENVVNGNFDFYAPSYDEVDFGVGTVKTEMIGTPGNAEKVITVGAYYFRPNWPNIEGTETVFNLPLGEIADYSSPGGRRRSDGVVKPDIAAPGSFTISPLAGTTGPESRTCGGDNMGAQSGTRYLAANGQYISWEGTSAAAPFTAGVIALMLEKNPTLNSEEIKEILIKTAKTGGTVGAVPNPQWGWGMLDPVAAIRRTPGTGRK
ncbi:MAG: S8 family serine peptidase [Pyrinomonadaceae bacterium]